MAKRLILILAVVLLISIGLLPVFSMVLKSTMTDGHINFAAYKNLLTSRSQWNLLGHSLILSSLTALLTTVVGLPLGILLAKTDLPFRRIFSVLFSIPLLIPPYIVAICWSHILGRDGMLAGLLGHSAAETTSNWFFGLPGCILVLFSVFLPIVILLTMTFLKTINPRLEEAGIISSGWTGVLKAITLPMILPGVLLASILVFLLTLGEFGVPIFLRYNVFPVETFTQFSAFYDFHTATATAVPLVVITLIVLLIERIFLRKNTYEVKLASDSERILIIPLANKKIGYLVLVSMFCIVIVILPLFVLVLQSISPDAYSQALSRSGDSLIRSLIYATIGASVLSILGFLCGYLIHNKVFHFWQSLDSVTIFLFALPSTLIGIGLVLLWNKPLTNFIYTTPIIIIFGYVAQYTALTSRITLSSLTQIPPSMEEAAQVAGVGWIRRFTLIVAPLVKRGLLAGWLVAYIFCLRDTGISMVVYPPGHDTLPVRIFTLMANGSADLIAALCVIMIIATLIPLGVLIAVFKSRKFF